MQIQRQVTCRPEFMTRPGAAIFRDFFRTDRDGNEKGVVLIGLESLP